MRKKNDGWLPFVIIAAIAIVALTGNRSPMAYHGPGLNYQSQSMYFTAPGRTGNYYIRGYTAN